MDQELEKKNEAKLCAEVQEVFNNINWSYKVYKKFSKKKFRL